MKTGKVIWGVFIAFIGVVILGINFNFWDMDIWLKLLYYWPVILILIGLKLTIPNDRAYLTILLVIIVAIAALIKFNPNDINGKITSLQKTEFLPTQNFYKSLDSETRAAKVSLNLGAVDIAVKGDDSIGNLYSGTFDAPEKIQISEKSNNGIQETIFGQETISSLGFGSQTRDFNLNLSPTLPYDFEINTGASNLDLDFSNLTIDKLSIDSGASNGTITIGTKSSLVETTISTGASKYTFNIPEDFAIYIRSESALTDHNFESLNLTKTDNIYKSADYETAGKKIKFDISAGVAKIDILKY